MAFQFGNNSLNQSFSFNNGTDNNNTGNNSLNQSFTFGGGSSNNNQQSTSNTNNNSFLFGGESNANSLNTTLNLGTPIPKKKSTFNNTNNNSFLSTPNKNDNNNNNNNNNTTSLFSSNNNNNTLFGTSNNNNNNNNNNSNNSNSNNNNNGSQPSFLFSSNANNNNNNNNNYSMNMNNMNNSNDNPLNDIQHIYNQYNGQHSTCRFETVLYNKIPSNINKSTFEKPPLIRPQIWEQGIKNNPSSSELIPVGIRGYKELNERSNLCLAGHCSSIKRFQEISEKVNKLKEEIDIKTKQTIHDLKQQQIYLSNRLLAILRCYVVKMVGNNDNNNSQIILNNNQNVSNLNISSLHSSSNGLSKQEMRLKHVLDQMSQESKQLMHLNQHINKLSSQLAIEGKTDKNGDIEGSFIGNTVIMEGLNHSNPKNMKRMFTFLKQQQQFVGLLAKTVQNDMKDMSVIMDGIDTKNKSSNHSLLFNDNASSVNYF